MAAQTTPKGMSSRLLTMKFMQRAAASTPPASDASTPKSDESSSKRRKISHSHSQKGDIDQLVDRQAIQAAIDVGERKREEALVKHAAELGDARWVLNVKNVSTTGTKVQKPLQVVQVGYAQIDSPDTSEGLSDSAEDLLDRTQPIRRSMYGLTPLQITEASDSSEDDDDASDDSDSSDTRSSVNEGGSGSRTPSSNQTGPNHNTGFAHKRSAEKARAKEFADKRRKKEIKLNPKSPGGLSSLSSGGGLSSLSSGGRPMQRQPGAFSFSCHKCGEVGHKAVDCKKPKQRSR
ncbi:zinc knuckle [Seiridium cupressi]|uniref:CCHC-type domain-containing protein n=1 Tax=Seiridium unicorne TaxID=138068 RepID=A0ABR2UNQ1_9PEZI